MVTYTADLGVSQEAPEEPLDPDKVAWFSDIKDITKAAFLIKIGKNKMFS